MVQSQKSASRRIARPSQRQSLHQGELVHVAMIVILMLLSSWSWAQSLSIPVEEVRKETQESDTKVQIESDQRSETKASSARSSAPVERVEVTGSHIRRIDSEGPAPVQTVSRKEIEKTGYNAVSDVLRDTSVSSFGGTRESSGSSAAGVAHVDLRGLGSTNTLVLLNGQRLPTDAVTGAVDLNMIPMAAVERVEILKDGASATYGSDALGGVVNIITRKDFSGTQAAYNVSQPEAKGGQRQEVSVVNGVNRGKLNMVNVAQYRTNEAIFSRDRAWTDKGVSNIGAPGSYRNASGKWFADPNCPADKIVRTPGGDFCSFKYSDFSTELPALQQMSILSETNYELNSKARLKARASGTRKTVQWSFAPAPDTFTIPAAIADKLGPGGTPLPGATPGQDLEVRYRLTGLGTRDTEIANNAYNLLLGTEVDLSSTWTADFSVSHNRIDSTDKGVNGYALTAGVQEAISSGRCNPFARNLSPSCFSGTRYQPLQTMLSQLSSVEGKVSGELFDMSGGAAGVAIGGSLAFQKYAVGWDDKSVGGEVFGTAGSNGGGQRDTKALFTEFSFPVTEKLELQLAGRYDKFSDFGDTVNPKAAFAYKANSRLLLRGSAGTGFKAPLMQDLYAARSSGFPRFIDQVACDRERALGGATPSCRPQQYEVESGGNSGLKEEKSVSYNFGAVYQPTADVNFGADVFLTQMNNVVGIDYDDLTRAEAKLGKDYLKSKGVIVDRDANGYINKIDAPLLNLSRQEISGMDLSAGVRVRKLRMDVNHSALYYFKREGFPGTGYRNILGRAGMPAWRNVASITYDLAQRHSLSVDGITTAGQRKTVESDGNLADYTQFNVNYTYNHKKLGTLTAGVRNVMASRPPIDGDRLNTDLYDQIGRQIYTGYRTTF